MQIAIVGPGGIGSTFAFQLSAAGHDVTVIARGTRLEQLRHAGAIVTVEGERAAVNVSGDFDTTTEWDLVLVTVLVSQVDTLLPALSASAAKSMMFMFNTFQSLDRLRDAVGPQRFAFGFPAIGACLDDGRLSSTIIRRGMLTMVSGNCAGGHRREHRAATRNRYLPGGSRQVGTRHEGRVSAGAPPR
jgi:2-dehydropantoate 2-reductase